jgi:hypothetical protein
MTNETEDISFRKLHVKDIYRKFGLLSNPFPVTGIASEDPGFPFFDEHVTKELALFVQDTYTRQFFGGFIVVGEYGYGKSYILKHLERRINEGLSMRGKDRACAIYVINPKTSASEFITSVLESFGMHSFLVMCWRLVTRRLNEEMRKQGPKLLEKLLPKPVQMDLFDYQEASRTLLLKQDLLSNPMKFIEECFRAKADITEISRFARDTFLPIFKMPDIAEGLALLSKLGGEDSSIQWKEWLNLTQLKKSIKRDINEPEFFRALMIVFRENGFRHIYILIDEFEDIWGLGKRERMEYLARLRDVIESNLEYFSIVLAVKSDEWAKVEEAHPAFVERFSRRIELGDLTLEQTRNMIASYLGSVRGEEAQPPSSPIYPFTNAGIQEIIKRSAGVPRVTLELCYVLLEHVAREKGLKQIDETIAQEVETIRESLKLEEQKQMSI